MNFLKALYFDLIQQMGSVWHTYPWEYQLLLGVIFFQVRPQRCTCIKHILITRKVGPLVKRFQLKIRNPVWLYKFPTPLGFGPVPTFILQWDQMTPEFSWSLTGVVGLQLSLMNCLQHRRRQSMEAEVFALLDQFP